MEKTGPKLYWSKKLPFQEYFQPVSFEEALQALQEFQEDSRIIAGGTDLIPQMRQEARVKALVDITRIPGMNEIHHDHGTIRIGASVTHSQILRSRFIREKIPCLWEAVSQIGSPQIRNIGTLGGNICNASPAADAVPPLLILEGTATITGRKGERSIPLGSFFTGPGQTVLGPSEILKEISIPEYSGHLCTAYLKLGRRTGVDLALVNVAVLLGMERDAKTCRSARICLGSVASTAIRAEKTEALLIGGRLDESLIREAGLSAARECRPISDVRGSAEYRRQMVGSLVERAIRQSLQELERNHA
jgi:carbon-monoxide dehydrogenase medium subunit